MNRPNVSLGSGNKVAVSCLCATLVMLIFIGAGCLNTKFAHATTIDGVEVSEVYRLYNSLSSEHLFTTDKSEYDKLVELTNKGLSHWKGEGISWYAPKDQEGNEPVYRLYNPGLGALARCSHYYTSNQTEIDELTTKYGWKKEAVAFYSGGDAPVYTAYSEALGSQHHYTSCLYEWSYLDDGWDKESKKNGGLGFFKAVRAGKSDYPTIYSAYVYQKEVYSFEGVNIVIVGENIDKIFLKDGSGGIFSTTVMYDDVDYTKINNSNYKMFTYAPVSSGINEITICQNDSQLENRKTWVYGGTNTRNLATFKINVLDYTTEENKFIDSLISNNTTDEMTSLEKMNAISNYLWPKMIYTRNYENEEGYATWMIDEGIPWWKSLCGNSYGTPAILCRIANRIGGFSEIHNCYYDYAYGTDEWYAYHAYCRCKEIIKGVEQTRYFVICPPSYTNVVKRSDIKKLDLTNTNGMTELTRIATSSDKS